MKKNLVGIFTRSRLGRFLKKYGGKISAILDVASTGVSLLTKLIHGVVDSVLLGVEAFRKIKTGSKLGGLLSAAKKGLKIDKLFSKIKNNRYLKGILNNKNLKVVGKSVYKFVSNPARSIQNIATSGVSVVKNAYNTLNSHVKRTRTIINHHVSRARSFIRSARSTASNHVRRLGSAARGFINRFRFW